MMSAASTRFGILHRPTNNFLGEFPTREEAEACVAEFSDAEHFEIVDFEEVFENAHRGGPCLLCGRDPAAGFASIGDEWYCHGDDDAVPTCYMRAQQAIAVVGEFWPEILPPEASV